MQSMIITSTEGLISLLDPSESDISKTLALKRLNTLVDEFWPEISDSITIMYGWQIHQSNLDLIPNLSIFSNGPLFLTYREMNVSSEELHERHDFPARDLAALVASKVFYHLSAFPDAMFYALRAEELFDINDKSQFVETIIVKCIDQYVRLRTEQSRNPGQIIYIDPRLERVAERMFDRCFQLGEYRHAVGIALQSRRLDKLEQSIRQSQSDMASLLHYTFRVTMDFVAIDFRPQVLSLLAKIYNQLPIPDAINVCRCLVFLEDAEGLASVLLKLAQSEQEDDMLIAFQISFELCDNASQQLLYAIRKLIISTAEMAFASPSISIDPIPITPITEMTNPNPQENPKDPQGHPQEPQNESLIPAQLSPESALDSISLTQEPVFDIPLASPIQAATMKKLIRILLNQPTIELYLQFLYRNNHTDLNILKHIKSSFEPRNSILHFATIAANALMHSGTTCDIFLRQNLDWVKRATNWTKFSMTAGLGVIHKGHLKEACKVLDPYLPKINETSLSVYTEGGSLYALGLIHANHVSGSHSGENFNSSISAYLLEELRSTAQYPIVSHGAALGIGVAAMGTANEEIAAELLDLLYSRDDAVSGEAAGYALGLVLLGTAHSRATELLNLAHESQHEKIIRGIVLGIACMYYGKEEMADDMIQHLIGDKDALLRYGGTFMIGLAYSGTSSNSAIKILLHLAVSDVNDDVRRAAVINLGFVLFRQYEQLIKILALLAESYNPAVRFGVCFALGIACAGTGCKEAYDMLKPLARSDPVDTVRQGALISMAMLLMQINDNRVQEFRKHLRELIEDKHEPIMCKYGAILASGILDAGGRNVTISLRTRTGHKNMLAIVGLVFFLQYWYWYPLVYFITLAFTPTAIIALNKDLLKPKMTFKSNVPPHVFAYPAETKLEPKGKASKMARVELSADRRGRSKRKLSEPIPILQEPIRSETMQSNLVSTQVNQSDQESVTTSLTTTAIADMKKEAASVSPMAVDGVEEVPSILSLESSQIGQGIIIPNGEDDNGNEQTLNQTNEMLVDMPVAEIVNSTNDLSAPPSVEPSFEILNNLARVTRAQFKYITFDVDDRYKPICDGTYGIVIVKDLKPELEQEIIHSGLPTSEDEPEPTPPAPFEYLGD